MALELVLGAVFDQFLNEIWRVKDNVVTFKPKLEDLEETLEVLSPVIQEIEVLNRRLNRHGRETISLRRLLEDGTKLVSECSKIPRWDLFKRSRYKEKLTELDDKILRFHRLYMQTSMARDLKETLLFVRRMFFVSLNQQGHSNLAMGLAASSIGSSNLSMDLAASSIDYPNLAMDLAASSVGSSNLAMDLTVSSTDSSYKQKIVMKVSMECNGCRAKALKIVSLFEGVSFIGLQGDDKDRVVVIGVRMNAVNMAKRLRKKFRHTNILSIAEV